MSDVKAKKGTSKSATTPRLTKAQLQAMEIRAAESVPALDADQATLEVAAGVEPTAVGKRRSYLKRPVNRPVVLTKEQEYAFIAADMRRLLITAGTLLAVMIVLLYVVEG